MSLISKLWLISRSNFGAFPFVNRQRQIQYNKGQSTYMDIKMLPISATRAKLLTMMALGGACFTLPVSAEAFLCDATQASAQELPLLASSCPIGKGLWGKQQPRGDQSTFWIQCGVLSKPLSVDEAKLIYQHISTDVWAKIEGKNARCLIGPYQDFSTANKELKAVKKLQQYKEAFVREVVKGAPPVVEKTKLAPAVVSKSSTPKAATPARQSTTIIPPASSAKIEPIKTVPEKAAAKSDKLEISIRRELKVGNLHFKVPYLPFSDDQFYMEYDIPWNRLDFARANHVCQVLGMEVPNPQQWQTLLAADVMKSHQWPMYLPYWGADNSALFTSGRVTQTSGKSLLNVMCVK